MLLRWLAIFIEKFSHVGAGLASWGPGFQPETPEELN